MGDFQQLELVELVADMGVVDMADGFDDNRELGHGHFG